jgi:hypothetical protein
MAKWRKLLPAALSLLAVIFPLSGCANPSWASSSKIIPPVQQVCPLEGKWTVLQDLTANQDGGGTSRPESGASAQFTGGAALFDGHVWNNPSYKIKKVDSTDYLMIKYVALSGAHVPPNQEVDVVTVYTASNFLGEFLKIDAANVIAFVQNRAELLHKVADRVDDSLTAGNTGDFTLDKSSGGGTSGVLIGLKIPSGQGFVYRTLWVAADNKKLHPILTRKDIFFPRSNGFWELEADETAANGKSENVLTAHDVAAKALEVQTLDAGTVAEQAPRNNTGVIDYIGNDYVAVENDSTGFNKLQVLPVDKISSSIGLKLSDLLGAKGVSAYNSAREQALRLLRDAGVTWIDENGPEDNFGLTRKNGHWYLQGRINYRSGGSPGKIDFPINLIPPANLIFYDTLYLSWQNIKERVPDAVDAFTSPNRDIALIKTRTKLSIYGMRTDQLDSQPLAEIKLEDGESIIMAEWATGSYVDSWEKAFLANGAEAAAGDLHQ